MAHRIEVLAEPRFGDAYGNDIRKQIAELGITEVQGVTTARIYMLQGRISEEQLHRLGRELLADPITQTYVIGRSPVPPDKHVVEVHLRPGVTDPVAASTLLAAKDMGIELQSVRTAWKYVLSGPLSEQQLQIITKRLLANDCIEQAVFGHDAEPPTPTTAEYRLQIRHVPIRQLDDGELVTLSRKAQLFLSLDEMRTIQQYYRRLGREPTDVELETLAQTWSEHCVHKTFKSTIRYEGPDGRTTIENLLASTIVSATRKLNKPWCISVFSDNAGVIEFDEKHAVCFKVETHNHPSAIEPYGGAATGIGGCIRDPLGTGLSAKPIANTDVFCFANPDYPLQELPKGVLHPRRVMRGVVAGVRDYGNRMGIPTVNGAICFDDRYLGNPLVFCGNVGLMDRDKCFKKASSGELILLVGGRTGRDGIHGATFSSAELTETSEDEFAHAVQIGNAIVEKKMVDTILQAREAGLFTAITDCGAGGLSSAVGEMGAELGAEVNLEKVPLKYAGLRYDEIWISEAQERMVLAVRPEHAEAISHLFAAEDVEATFIGRFTDDKMLRLRYDGHLVGELEMDFLHHGRPSVVKNAVWHLPAVSEPQLAPQQDYTGTLHRLLGSLNIASKHWVIRQYDHEVQGGSVIKPLVGAEADGPSDAAVLRPVLGSHRAIAIGCGINPRFGDLDPYAMALACVDEAIRNVVAVGADPQRIAILDNFCWGNCDKPDRLGALVRAARGCHDAAIAYGTPFISGKDSLNNEFTTDDGRTIAIPPTLLISAISVITDARKCVTMDLKRSGNVILLVGATRNELGGSQFYALHGQLGANVPRVDLRAGPATAAAVAELIKAGLVRSCHDLSEGGLAVAVAEMAFAGGFGARIDLAAVAADTAPASSPLTDEQLLFSETPSRYLLEIEPQELPRAAAILKTVRFAQIGTVTDDGLLRIRSLTGRWIIEATINELKRSWQEPLDW